LSGVSSIESLTVETTFEWHVDTAGYHEFTVHLPPGYKYDLHVCTFILNMYYITTCMCMLLY